MNQQYIVLTLIFLAAAVFAVPLAKKIGLGSILGYLAAGAVIGPFGAKFVLNAEELMHFAEFGVVFLLFVIGLELKPARLWVMRKAVFGLGGMQVIISTFLLSGGIWFLGLSPLISLVLGFSLSLSSTAFALQYLSEKNQLNTEHGRSAFAILLFQDVAVIPVLAVIPLVFVGIGSPSPYPAWAGIFAVLAILLLGRWITGPIFRLIAGTKSREVFTAVSLLMVLGVAALMQSVGLSMGLGSFLVGVILSESEYRHELETDIEPFKGLLLGLFFMAVGMMVNLDLLFDSPFVIIGVLIVYMLIKFFALFISAKIFGLSNATSRNLSLSIAQGSEFSFVIITMLLQGQVMQQGVVDTVILTVSLSMALTPLLGIINERFVYKKFQSPAQPFDEVRDEENPEIIIAGLGRFGQIISRLLRLRGIPFTALEHDPDQVETLRKFGNKVYYGDASRIDLLEKAGALRAKFFILAIDDVDASLFTAKVVREHFPHLKVLARARNRQHAFDLRDLGIELIERETFWSSVRLARELLVQWGEDPKSVTETIEIFVKHDLDMFEGQYQRRHNEDDLINFSKQAGKQLMEVMRDDRQIIKDLPAAHGVLENRKLPTK